MAGMAAVRLVIDVVYLYILWYKSSRYWFYGAVIIYRVSPNLTTGHSFLSYYVGEYPYGRQCLSAKLITIVDLSLSFQILSLCFYSSVRPSWDIVRNYIVFCFIIIAVRCLRVFRDNEFVLSVFTESFVSLRLCIFTILSLCAVMKFLRRLRSCCKTVS